MEAEEFCVMSAHWNLGAMDKKMTVFDLVARLLLVPTEGSLLDTRAEEVKGGWRRHPPMCYLALLATQQLGLAIAGATISRQTSVSADAKSTHQGNDC